MGVKAVGTSNVGINGSLKEASAIADAVYGTSNVSMTGIVSGYMSPNDTTPPYYVSYFDNQSYRKLAISIDTSALGEGSISVTYPTTYTNYRLGGSAISPAPDNTLTYLEADDGQRLYLRGTSYSTFSYVAIQANADYGYIFNTWSWYNEAGTFIASATGNPLYLYSTSYTSDSYYRLEAEFDFNG